MDSKAVRPLTRADQRNAVVAGFLGWTLDAFDFFQPATEMETRLRPTGSD